MKLKYLSAIGVFLLGAAMTSCDDDNYDVTGNPNNLVYVNIAHDYPANMPKNTFGFNVLHTPAGPMVTTTPGDILIDVACTKNAPTDINVNLAVDPTLQVAGYKTLPENSGVVVTLDEDFVTIPQGTTHSNTVAAHVDITNADWSLFENGVYLLPIKIESTNSGVPSSEIYCAYVGFNVESTEYMVNPYSNYAVDGTMIDPSAFSGTWSAPAIGRGGNLNANAWDDNNWSYVYFVSNHADKVNEETVLNIDMGAPYKVKGLKLQYYYYWYTIKDAKLETSMDGVEYTDQGTIDYSNDDNNFTRYVSFWSPVEYRYIRITTHSYYGGTGEGTAFADYIAYE